MVRRLALRSATRERHTTTLVYIYFGLAGLIFLEGDSDKTPIGDESRQCQQHQIEPDMGIFLARDMEDHRAGYDDNQSQIRKFFC
jgi:hypothetical protein